MSRVSNQTVEERILEFKFNNDQFEQGVKQSMSTLEQLKRTTADAMHSINGRLVNGLKNLFKGFHTKGVEDNVQAISNRFSTLGIVGQTVIQRLTNGAINLGLSLGKKVLSPLNGILGIVKNKGWDRATGIKQAQFMIQNLGLDWEKADKIIDKAVTDTRFGYNEAAVAAAQLATSGIEFGEDMKKVLQAIGNAASMANVEYSDMAHLFTTMASNGRVYGMQLQQMSIRGINATKALADYLGKTEAQVKDLVSKGKVSFNDFVAAINQTFGEAAFKANETFSGVLANNKAVFARIGQVYASGFMDAAKVVLQHTLPVLKKFRDEVEVVGKVASKAMMLVANFLAPIIDRIDLTPLKNFIDKFVKPIGDYIDELNGQITGVKKTVEDTVKPAEDLLEIANKVIRGDYGNGQTRRDQLEELGYSYERVQNKVNELLGCSFRYEVAEEDAAESTEQATEATSEQVKALKELDKRFAAVENLKKFVGGLKDFLNMGKYIGKTLYDEVVTRIIGFLPTAFGFIAQRLGTIGGLLSKFSNWVVGFDLWGKIIRNTIDWLDIAVGVFKAFVSPVKRFVDDVLASGSVQRVFGDIVKIFERFVNAITSTGSAVKNAYKDFRSLSGVQRLATRFGKILTWLREKVLDLVIKGFDKLHEILGKEPNESKGLFKLFSEDGIFNKGANAIADFFDTVEKYLGTVIGNKMSAIYFLFSRFGNYVTDHFPKVANVFETVKDAVKGFFSAGAKGEAMGGALQVIGDLIDRIKNLEGVQKLTQALSDLGSVIKEKLLDGLKSLLEYIDKTFGTKLTGQGDEFINMFGEGGVVDTASEIISRLVDGLSNVPGAIEKFFDGLQNIPDWLSSKGELGAGIADFMQTLYTEASKGIPSFFTFITKQIMGSMGDATASLAKEGLLGVFGEGFSNNINSVVDGITKFIGIVLKGDEALKVAKGSIDNVSDGSLEPFIEMVKNFGETAGPIIKDLTDRFANAKNWGVWDFIELLKGYGIAKILIKTGGAIGSFGKIFKNTATVIGSFKDLGKSVESIMTAFEGVPKSISGAFGSLDTLAKNWSNVGGVFKEWRKKPLTTALRDFAIAVALVAGSIALLGSDFVNYDRIRENKDVLLGFAGAIGTLAIIIALAPPQTIDALSKAFIGLGIALVALVAAVAIFGHMKMETLVQGGGFIVAFMAGIALAARIASGSGSMAVLGFAAMALAVNLLIPAILFFAHMAKNDWQSLVYGGGALIVFMIAMAGAARLASSGGKMASVGFLAMALAINLLIPALLFFIHMTQKDFPALLKGGAVLVAFMYLMAGAIRLASKHGGKGAAAFLALAVAINLIVPALVLLSMLKFSKILGAAVALGGTLLAIGKSIEMASRNKGSIPAAIAMAAATYLIAIGLVELSTFPLARVLASATALVLVFASLALAFNSLKGLNMKQLWSEVGALLAVVGGIGFVIGALAMLTDVGTVIGIAVSIGGLALALSLSLRILSGMDPKMAIKAGLALDAFAVCIAALIGVGAALVDFFQDQGIDVVGNLNQLGLAIHGFLAGLHGEDVNSQAKNVEEAGSSLSNFADNIGRFLDILDQTDETKAANAEHLANAIWSLTKTEIAQAVANWLGLDPDFGAFGDSMVAYAQSFYSFADIVNGEDDVQSKKMNSMLEATDLWIDLANKLEPNAGLFPTIAGLKDIGKFGEQMAAFGNAFYQFVHNVNSMEDVDTDRIWAMRDGAEIMLGLANQLKANKGVIPDIVGIQDIGLFGTQLRDFSEGFKKFYQKVVEVGDVDPSVIQNIADATMPMVTMASNLVSTGGLLQHLGGEKDLADFGNKLSTFASKIVEFCEVTNTDTISPIRLNAIGTALSKIATLDGNANDAYAYLSAFSEAFGRLGASIGTFGENSKSFNPEDLTAAIESFEKLRDFINSLSGFSDADSTGFVKAFTDLSKTSTAKFAEGFSDAVPDVSAAIIQFLIDVAKSIANDNGAQFKLAGTGAANKYGEGFSGNGSVLTGTVTRTIQTAVASAAKMADKYKPPGQSAASAYAAGITKESWKANDAVKDMKDSSLKKLDHVYYDFYDKGINAAQGFADGIEDRGSRAVDRARDLADQASSALASALDERSPSKVTKQMGVYFGEGFINGIRAMFGLSKATAEELGYGTLAVMMTAVSSLADMIDQNVDMQPTITPVVDTTGVEYGMVRVNDMLNSMRNPVNAMLNGAAMDQNHQLALKADRNSANYTDQFNQLIESNGELIDAVRQNRYAIIDGDSAFDYLDRRLGQAQA